MLKQAEVQELPKLSLKEVTFTIDPFEVKNSQKICISQHESDYLVTAKRVKRPVVLFNKDESQAPTILPKQPKLLKIEPRKMLPDVILYR